MSYQIKVQAETFEQLQLELGFVNDALKGNCGPGPDVIVKEIVEVKPIKAAASKPAKKAKASAVKEKELDIKDVIKALTPVNEQLGKDTAKGVLKEFKAAKLSDIPKDKYEDFIKYCEEVLASSGAPVDENQADMFA